jgi:exonuclease III
MRTLSSFTRLVAWNVCGGGGTRVGLITTALAQLAPSVVVLSEIKANRLAEWRDALAQIGLAYQSHAIGSVSVEDPYTVLVASTLQQEPHPWPLPPPFPNRAVRVRVGGLSVTGVHAPDQRSTGREFYKWLVDATSASLTTDAILLGDFNADQSGDAMLLNRHFLPLIETGWTHGTRHLQPDGDHTSWWGRVNGFAIDHCLLSPPLVTRLHRAELLDAIEGVPTAGRDLRIANGALSDHRPLLVDLVPSAT